MRVGLISATDKSCIGDSKINVSVNVYRKFRINIIRTKTKVCFVCPFNLYGTMKLRLYGKYLFSLYVLYLCLYVKKIFHFVRLFTLSVRKRLTQVVRLFNSSVRKNLINFTRLFISPVLIRIIVCSCVISTEVEGGF